MTDAAPSHPPLLAARGLAFSRNDEPVFGPLEFAVDAGEALLVQGGNGAGKTTLLRAISKLIEPTATNFSLAAYRFSSEGYLDFGEFARLRSTGTSGRATHGA